MLLEIAILCCTDISGSAFTRSYKLSTSCSVRGAAAAATGTAAAATAAGIGGAAAGAAATEVAGAAATAAAGAAAASGRPLTTARPVEAALLDEEPAADAADGDEAALRFLGCASACAGTGTAPLCFQNSVPRSILCSRSGLLELNRG
jgi:hypothetical protein